MIRVIEITDQQHMDIQDWLGVCVHGNALWSEGIAQGCAECVELLVAS